MTMKKNNAFEQGEAILKTLSKGAFLTTAADGKQNTMTIGWATIGCIWQRAVFMVAVRDSRHTFTLMEQADTFTVPVPAGSEHNKAVAFCGTKSGRDYDKFKECGLVTRPAQHTASPIIDIPGVHYECRIVYKTAMDPALLDPAMESLYPQKDYHTLYFGEILACYETK